MSAHAFDSSAWLGRIGRESVVAKQGPPSGPSAACRLFLPLVASAEARERGFWWADTGSRLKSNATASRTQCGVTARRNATFFGIRRTLRANLCLENAGHQ